MEDIQKSVYYTVAQICTQESERVQFEIEDDAIATLCEVVMGYSGFLSHNTYYIECLAKDLDCFSAHAKRTTINPSDVRLVARKQPNIVSRIDSVISVLDEEKKKKRKKNDTSS